MAPFHAYRDGGCQGGGLLVSAPAEAAGFFCGGEFGGKPRKRARAAAASLVAAAGSLAAKKQRQEKVEAVSLDALPDECLFEVLRRLPGGGRERGASACVSRRWLGVLGSIRASEVKEAGPALPDLNQEFVIGEESEGRGDGCAERSLEGKEATDVRLAAMAIVAGARGGLGKLSVKGSHPVRGVTDHGLSAVARGCPSLRSLSLWDVPLVTDAGLAEVAAGCPLLERLDITCCPLITDKGLAAIARGCPNLMALTVESCSGIGNEGLRTIGQCCSKLQAINIKNCAHVGDQGVSSLVCSATASLTKIRLQGLNISDVSLAVVGYYGKAVTELTLTRLPAVAERGFWVMANALGLQKLRCMSVTSCPGVTDLALASIAKLCPSLKQICLRKCSQVSDAGLKASAEFARVLESLQLEECIRVTLGGVLSFLLDCSQKFKTLALVKCLGIKDIRSAPAQLPLCKSLRSLTIRDCPGFTDASLAVVGMICPQLEHVDLSGLVGVTDSGLLPLVQSSKGGLVNVELSGCKNITDAAVSSLVKAHGESLEQLSLDGCSKVTDASLFAIAESCVQLAELDLSKCMVGDYGIAVLASARQLKLRVLSLSACSKVTLKSVPFLGNMGESLEGLNLQFCNMIGNHGIASLEEKLWWCDILA